MLSPPTMEKLHTLKLAAMAAAWTAQQQDAPASALSFDERFGLLVEAEWVARENARLTRHLQAAKLKLGQACLEALDYAARRELDKPLLRQLATGRWVAEHQQVLITGATGTGKTFVACALAHHACRQGYRARYWRVARLFAALALARADGTYQPPPGAMRPRGRARPGRPRDDAPPGDGTPRPLGTPGGSVWHPLDDRHEPTAAGTLA